MANLGVFSQEFMREIAPSTGERNIIVHEYEVIDDLVVFQSIDETVEKYGKYIDAVLNYLKR